MNDEAATASATPAPAPAAASTPSPAPATPTSAPSGHFNKGQIEDIALAEAVLA